MDLLSDRCTFQLQDPYVDPSLGQGDGFRSIKISAFLRDQNLAASLGFGENEVGSITVSWIDPDLWWERCATPLHYKALRRVDDGLHKLLCEKGPDLTNLSSKDAQDVATALSKMFRWVKSFEPQKAIEMALEEHREWWQVAVDQLVGNPYVDYIKVRKDFRQQGLAKAMYSLAGCYMATKGYTLRGSTCQHHAASAVWQSMALDPAYPTRRIKLGDRVRFLLDYRRQQSQSQSQSLKQTEFYAVY